MDHTQLNGLALAYMGDAVYEQAIRHHLLEMGKTKPNQLHHTATRYVSAKAQAHLIHQMQLAGLLTDEEVAYYRRGRNAKTKSPPKNTNIQTYQESSGFEALMGYLYLDQQSARLDHLIQWCIEKIEEGLYD